MQMAEDAFSYRFFESDQHREEYRTHLPHWRQEGALYFVTFRLNDSIPTAVIEEWSDRHRQWLKAHGMSPGLSERERALAYAKIPMDVRLGFERERQRRYFVTLDRCHGACPLRDPVVARLAADAMHFFHGQRLHCGDFVVMPNHIHWILAPYREFALEKLCGAIKQFSATQINKLLNRTGRLWQSESFDHIVRNADHLRRIRRYIRDNPRHAQLQPDENRYYSADWLVENEDG